MRALLPGAALAALLLAPAAHAEPFELQPLFVSENDFRVHSNRHLEAEDGFSAERLRLGARLSFTRWFRATAAVELVGESPRILDAMITVVPDPAWEISLGAGRTPLFSSARDEPLWTLPLPELSMVTRAFWPGYDAGIELHRLPTPGLPLEGWLRLGNGSGSALGNDNSDYALDARLDVAFGRALPRAQSDAFLGLRLGSGLHLESAEDRLGISPTTPGGFAFYAPVTVSGPRSLAEAHLVLYAGPLKLTAEAALAREGRSRDTDGKPDTPRVAQAPVSSKGAFAELAWMIRGPRRRQGRWPVESPLGTWDWGALELGGRVERLRLGTGAPDVDPGGATSASLALRWWATSFAALTASATFTSYDTPPITEPDRTSGWLGLFRATVRLPEELTLRR